MHVPIATIWVAIAVCRVGVGSNAAPSGNIFKSPRPQVGVPTKRRLRSDKLAPDEEERGDPLPFDLNFPPLREADEIFGELVGKTGESSGKLLNDGEQVVKLAAIEDEKKKEQLKLLYDWKQSFESFAHALKKAKNEELKELLNGRINTLDVLKYDEAENLTKLLEGWKPPVEPIVSDLKSSTERLQVWLENDGKSPDELFKVLGIHKAADEAANSLLISMNLERWNFVMESLDKTGSYNFETKLKQTLLTYCGDDSRAELFLERLIILRQETSPDQLEWLHQEINPKNVYGLMELDKEKKLWIRWPAWSTYVNAFSDLHPEHQKTPIAAFPYPDFNLIAKVSHGISKYPLSGTLRFRMLDEILRSWATTKPPVGPACAFMRLSLQTDMDSKALSIRLQALTMYLAKINGSNPRQQAGKVDYDLESKSLTNREHLLKMLGEEKLTLHDPTRIKEIDDYLEFLKPNSPSKRKPEAPHEDARDPQQPRGE